MATVGILYLLPNCNANISSAILLIPYGFCGFDILSGVFAKNNSPPSSVVKSNIPFSKFSSNLESGRTSLPRLSRYNPSPNVA